MTRDEVVAIQNKHLKIGNVLERKVVVFTDDRPFEVWKRGTIIEIENHQICLEYEDGSREFVERGRGMMRHP